MGGLFYFSVLSVDALLLSWKVGGLNVVAGIKSEFFFTDLFWGFLLIRFVFLFLLDQRSCSLLFFYVNL
jgi:hypothetical protein